MPEQIVVPVDASNAPRRALAVAHTLARQIDADVVALVVAGDRLSADRLTPWGLAASVGCDLAAVELVDDGRVAEDLVAVTHDPDRLLCLATHGRTADARAPFGRVTARVLAQAGGPALLAGPHVPDEPVDAYRNAVVGCPGDGHGVTAAGEVRMLARAGLHPWFVEVLRSSRPGRQSDVPLSGPARQAGRDLDIDGATSWEVVHDTSVPRGLARFADGVRDPIVVVGTHGRAGLPGLVRPDVALQLARRSPVPVMAVPGSHNHQPALAGAGHVPRVARLDVRLDADRVPLAITPSLRSPS